MGTVEPCCVFIVVFNTDRIYVKLKQSRKNETVFYVIQSTIY
jgi:hypothetical protein